MTVLIPVEPQTAARMVEGGALLIDVREADERARLRIPGSRHAPLSRLADAVPAGDAPAVIFYCRSGNRTATQAARLAAIASGSAYALTGGIEGWRAAGLPILADARAPLELSR